MASVCGEPSIIESDNPELIAVQLWPPLVLLKAPQTLAPAYKVLGFVGSMASESIVPPETFEPVMHGVGLTVVVCDAWLFVKSGSVLDVETLAVLVNGPVAGATTTIVKLVFAAPAI